MKRELGAVVLAAGRGQRLGHSLPKAYVLLGGKPLLLHSLERIARFPPLGEIVVVIHPDDEELFRSRVEPLFTLERPQGIELRVVPGGEHRQDSALAGVRASRRPWVAVHDAARPFFSPELLQSLWKAARGHGAAVPVLPVRESLHESDHGHLVRPLDREKFVRAQTPQLFERKLLLRALEEAQRRGARFTDEAGAVLAFADRRPRVVPGEELNLKITTPWDLEAAEAWRKAGLLPPSPRAPGT